MKSCLEKMDAGILFLEGCWNLKKYLNSGFVILCDIHNLWFIIYEEMIDSIGKRRCWDIILNGNINISILDFLFSIIYIYNLIWNGIILEKQIFEYYFYNFEFFSYSLPRWYIAWKRKTKERNSLAIGAEVISPLFSSRKRDPFLLSDR